MQRIVEIENAIVKHIAEAKLPYLRFVGSYNQELSGDFSKVVRSLPAIWVVFKGASAAKSLNTARDRWRAEYSFTTVVADRSLRTEKASRIGSVCSASQGTYGMLKDVHDLICLNDFGLDGVDYFSPGSVKQLINGEVAGQAISVYAQEWSTTVDYYFREPGQRIDEDTTRTGYLPPYSEESHLPDFDALHIEYWLKPPRDMQIDPADAKDIVTLNIQKF